MSTFRPLWAWLFAALLAPSPLCAGPLSLKDLLETAKSNNPALTQAKAEAQAMVERLRQQAAMSNPDLNLSGGIKQTPQGDGSIASVGVRQKLPFWGPQAGWRKLADIEVTASVLRLREAEAELARAILEVAGEHVLAKHLWQNALDRQRRLAPMKVLLNTQTFASPQQRIDQAVVETRLLNLEAEQATLLADVSATAKVLGALAGVDAEKLELKWDFSDLRLVASGTLTGLDETLAQNPAIALAKLEADGSLAERDIASRSGRAEPGVSLSYGREDAGGVEQNVLLGLELPLPFSGQNRHGMSAADRRREAALALQAALKQRVTAQWGALEERRKGLVTAAAVHDAKAVQRLEGQVVDAELQLKRGQIALLSYLELEDQLVRTRDIMDNNSLKMVKLLADIQALAGGTSVPAALSR